MITKDKTYFVRNQDEMEIVLSELNGFFEEVILSGGTVQVDTWVSRRGNLQQPVICQSAGEVH